MQFNEEVIQVFTIQYAHCNGIGYVTNVIFGHVFCNWIDFTSFLPNIDALVYIIIIYLLWWYDYIAPLEK